MVVLSVAEYQEFEDEFLANPMSGLGFDSLHEYISAMVADDEWLVDD